MPSFKYVGDEEISIPAAGLNRVKSGDTIDVDDDVAAGLEGQPLFQKSTKSKSKTAAAAEEE